MGLLDFLTADYATRQQRTRDLNDRLEGLLNYYLGPTGIPDRLSSANALLNPIDQIGEAGANTVVAFDPTRSRRDRMQAALNAGLGTVTAAAPAIGGAVAGQPARRALMETLVGASDRVDDAAARLASDIQARGGTLAADATGLGRGLLARDPEMIGEVFQTSQPRRSLSAGSANTSGLGNALSYIPEEQLRGAVPFTRSGSEYFSAPRQSGGRAKDPALYTPFSTIKQDRLAPSDWSVSGRIIADQLETPTAITAEDLQRLGYTVMYPYPADATMAATIVDEVNGLALDTPVLQQAGHAYPDYAGRGFASDRGVLTSKNNIWRSAYAAGGKPIVTPMVMGAKGGDFSQHVSQTQAQLIRAAAERGLIDPNFAPKIPEKMRENFVGLLDPRFPAYMESLTGGERGALMKSLDTAPAMSAGVPSVAATRFATMDPNLINSNMLESGYRLFQPEEADSVLTHGGDLHSTYDASVNRIGDSMTMGETRPWYLMFPDEAGPKMEMSTRSGANMLNTNAMPKDLRAFQMNPKLHQVIDDQWVHTNMMYDEILRSEGREAADQYAYDSLISRVYGGY